MIDWLDAYFNGDVVRLPVDAINMIGTDFQKSVWDALITIPSGKSISYRGLADQLGNAKAVRAVARANALNPVSIIVPCHRVIGSNGTLTGYAGGLIVRNGCLITRPPCWRVPRDIENKRLPDGSLLHLGI